MKTIEINCDHCGKSFDKPQNEYNRSIKLNRKNYCSRSCSGKSTVNMAHIKSVSSGYDISKHSGNSKDEFTGFRDFLRSCKRRDENCILTLTDLKTQWEQQNGLCPYTNFKLILKRGKDYTKQASLDRIDNSKGYTKDNIEFISLPINYMKNDKLSKEETIALIKEISLSFH